MKSVKLFGRQIPVFVIALLAMASIGTGAMLASYGTVIGTADVEQGVSVTGDTTYVIGDSPAQAGNTYTNGVFTVKNNAENPATVALDTTCTSSLLGQDDGTRREMSIDWSTVGGGQKECDGIITSYFGVLELTTKNTGTWEPTTDMKATIYHTLVGESFTVSGIPEGYVLIYYPNTEGDVFATNVANALPLSLIDESLPIAEDVGDNYCGNGFNPNAIHCSGAKFWLIPAESEEAAMTKLASWTEPDTWLFETDLITYTKGADNKITLPANGGGFNFVVENQLDIALNPDIYTLTTDMVPV